ncbi:MAG: hypothetical protein SH821_02795 [Phototrophicales bacterium]|nr:hypothetical protein [Phototrophicales bacterium]
MTDETPYDDDDELQDDDYADEGEGYAAYRGATNDPIFGLLLAVAVSVGLMPLIGSDGADVRYTITWGMLALFGVLAWLFGDAERIGQEKPDNVMWGVIFGLVLGVPLLLFGGSTLTETSRAMFPNMTTGVILGYLVFIIPLGETLFFRGVLQRTRPFWEVGAYATGWSLLQVFPLININALPLVAGFMLLMSNMLYSYVHDRNGLAAAWVCQITIHLLLFFIPIL